MVATIKIQYWGGWGYGRQSDALQQVLSAEFGSNVTFQPMKDQGITGNFEVSIVESGEVIHSKAGGKGKCESNSERGIVVEKIQEFLDSQ